MALVHFVPLGLGVFSLADDAKDYPVVRNMSGTQFLQEC
jgi:hypothetical protein